MQPCFHISTVRCPNCMPVGISSQQATVFGGQRHVCNWVYNEKLTIRMCEICGLWQTIEQQASQDKEEK